MLSKFTITNLLLEPRKDKCMLPISTIFELLKGLNKNILPAKL
jgi:hypothetical protein